jgi:hypothetical protein
VVSRDKQAIEHGRAADTKLTQGLEPPSEGHRAKSPLHRGHEAGGREARKQQATTHEAVSRGLAEIVSGRGWCCHSAALPPRHIGPPYGRQPTVGAP